MQVEAIQLGYYDLKRRRPGDKFVLSNPAHFSKKWMKRVGGDESVQEQEPEPVQDPTAVEAVAQAEETRRRGRPRKNAV